MSGARAAPAGPDASFLSPLVVCVMTLPTVSFRAKRGILLWVRRTAKKGQGEIPRFARNDCQSYEPLRK